MDTLKIEAMIPSSLSEIGIQNEESDFVSLPGARVPDRLTDYHIKVNGPDLRDSLYDENFPQIPPARISSELMPTPEPVEYRGRTTGYNLHRDAFS
jgi:hypothetical protein